MKKPARKKDPEEVQVRTSRRLRRRAHVYALQHERELREVIDELLEEGLKKRGA